MAKIENFRTKAPYDPDSRYEAYEDTTPAPETDGHVLDGPEAQRILGNIREWWDQARQLQSENREQQAIDDDFYDGLQWSDEDVLELQQRGQAPLVFNLCKQTVDWVIGTERRTRIDHNVLARNEDKQAQKDAQNKSKLLKYVSDVNHDAYARSLAFADAVKVGVGWLEDGIHDDESDELLFSRRENWRNMWYDPLSIERDLSDARFLFRDKWLDLDVAETMFPDRLDELHAASDSQQLFAGDDESDDFWYARLNSDGAANSLTRRGWVDETGSVTQRRRRVRMVECWYRMPEQVKKMRGWDPALEGMQYDKEDEKHNKALNEGVVSLHDAVVMKIHVVIFSGNYLFQLMRSPYRHNRFPFTPIWASRRGRDNAPYGTIRNIRDPQEDLNKRGSKALFILSTNQVIADKQAVADWDATMDEVARPDGRILLEGDRRFELNNDKQLAEEHLMLMDRDQAMIRNASGVQGENLAEDTNAISGRAIEKKQNEGSLVTFELFDNLRFAVQLQGEIRLSLVEQYYDMPKTIRLTGDNNIPEFTSLNQPEWNPLENKYVFINDIQASQSSFIVDQQDFRATIRQAMFEQLMDMLSKMESDTALKLLDVVIDLSDAPQKDELVKRIREINGQSAPDDEETPEEMEVRQAKEREAAEARQLEIDEITSKIDERKAKIEQTRVSTQKAAMETAEVVATIPGVAPVADQVLREAGFEGESRTAMPLPSPTIQQPRPQLAPPPTAARPPPIPE